MQHLRGDKLPAAEQGHDTSGEDRNKAAEGHTPYFTEVSNVNNNVHFH